MLLNRFIDLYLDEVHLIASLITQMDIENAVKILLRTRKQGGRLFILGVGGSAANASHAVNDFRKIAKIEAYAPTDNVSELTARTNDEGWDSTFVEWLKISNLSEDDTVMILSVGGGSDKTSQNIVRALEYANYKNASVIGIVSRDGGYTKRMADICISIPVVDPQLITPHAEEWQGVIWHLIVNAIKVYDES